jgi:hypothetical protein
MYDCAGYSIKKSNGPSQGLMRPCPLTIKHVREIGSLYSYDEPQQQYKLKTYDFMFN